MSNTMKLKTLFNESKNIEGDFYDVLNVALISNITLEPYFDVYMKKFFKDICIRPCVNTINLEEYFIKENITKITNSNIIIVWLNYELLCPNMENSMLSYQDNELSVKEVEKLCYSLIECLKKHSSSEIIFFGFENMYCHTKVFEGSILHRFNVVDNLNNIMSEYLYDYAVVIDLKKIIASVGTNNAYNYRMKYMWNSPYSKEVMEASVKEIYKQYLIMNGITKKCIVLDCDNVLWGGIISEDGFENIKLGTIGSGRSFQEFQRFLLNLYYHGIILTICSKNDLNDVLSMFRQHSGMLLKEEHIACFQVNWQDKADNIVKISNTLNIGLDSMIFIDDSIFEIALVKNILPEVTSILYDIKTIYEQLSILNLPHYANKENIKNRNQTYRTNEKRKKLEYESKTFDDYLKALGTVVSIHKANTTEYNRISELSLRTNKFTNGKRYTMACIKQRIDEDEYCLYSVFVSDKFSDFGLVGSIGIDKNKIDLFCLSCRALGRSIEDDMLKFVTERHRIEECVFVSTGKNDTFKKILGNFNIKNVD